MPEFRVRGRMVTLYRHIEEIEAKDAAEALDMAEAIENQLLMNNGYIKDELVGTKLSRIVEVTPV